MVLVRLSIYDLLKEILCPYMLVWLVGLFPTMNQVGTISALVDSGPRRGVLDLVSARSDRHVESE
jgi:hypothetical protein